ncbi:RelA/SpoT family protein [Tessaracoccus flavus]|uniref:Bifunctional (P)ppGpp synthetase/guanosine-3',5'-bis(Diphosphate) 3'-pyrophosphohydrolase n=1 Tax=Tessaracoccus flavus TaxID=1610493 RepID=A0A1Q2CEB9_9ACTN|nr:bifunctional (p)ppGpp synthetase/guanosine-3',5'-bis(diphosphate) 3'-pyrophosphohydrolase [Tessaracoccus flavus]AQP44469.1 bifunctional (p)ppGpp synthetase/guanosine-3',5'-bis(diphosphate) 3'-pyrophosphohydrolase [Tessaracoccus flavus]SDY70329.1 GTP pyrophosphokinase [Tessaracoccus flavus]
MTDEQLIGASRLVTGPEQPRLRMRHRIARLGAVRPKSAVLDPLFRIVKSNHPKADLDVIERAYRIAEHHHQGQTRKSGDPYITHPLAVATILAELGMTEPVLVAALLHDTVEDTEYTIEQLRADFSDEVAHMVDGVTKLDKLTYGETAKAETIRKMIMATSEEVRVLVIKLADRLHNMRTISFLRPEKQVRIATETLNIFAPLAHRLGMNTIKWELEDLSFSCIEPKVYAEIVEMVAQQAPFRERYLRELIAEFQQLLAESKITATVYGRPKHYYSIYQKMMVRGRDFKDIYDLIGLRVLVDTPADCYAVLGVAHAAWKPIPGRFKDYIAGPKFNMYQSLHTTVMGANNEPVELQIRTHEMHRRAEYGVAAHWKYKQDLRDGVTPEQAGLRAIHQLGVMSKETEDPSEFLDSVLFEINADEIYVFTPKGEVIALPVGATPVDFAFAVHTEVGYRCIGARVNGRLVALSTKLVQGDKVEVLTSKAQGAGPSRDWLGFVVSSRARQKIRQYFSRERRDEAIEQGKETLAKDLRRTGIPLQRLLTLENLTAVANELGHKDVPNLYNAIGEGHLGAQGVVEKLIALHGGEDETVDTVTEDVVVRQRRRPVDDGAQVLVDGDNSVVAKFAKCCYPLPGDEIVGFVTRGDGVSVHRADCTNVPALLKEPDRMVPVAWSARTPGASFLVTVQVEGIDRARLLSDVSSVLSEQHVDIVSVNINTNKQRQFSGKITFESADPTHLQHVMAQVRKVPGVYDVFRVAG